MNRTSWLAALAVVLAPGAASAQFGGMGGMGGSGSLGSRRAVQVELEGGRRVLGRIQMASLTIYGDLGQYTIQADKIKAIRFLKPPSEPRDDDEDQPKAPRPAVAPGVPNNNARAMMMQMQMQQMRGVNVNNGMGMAMVRAKVILHSGEEIIGNIPYGTGFSLTVDYGTLLPATDKLRSMTFGEAEKTSGPPGPAEGSPRAAGDVRDTPPAQPRYFRYHQSLVVRSPAGDRIALYNMENKQRLELTGPKDAPLEIAPLYSADVMALGLSGTRIVRIAVADVPTGWHIQELRQPAEGTVTPILAQGVAVYVVGRYVYAYGVEAHRWDVAELPEVLQATPVVAPNSATIEGLGHIFIFAARTGRWEHIDVRKVLDAGGSGRK